MQTAFTEAAIQALFQFNPLFARSNAPRSVYLTSIGWSLTK